MPFFAEAEYPNSDYGTENFAETWGVPYLKRSARLCAELGADIIKSNWTGSVDTFAEIVDSVPVPVVVAGGSRVSDLDLLQNLQAAREAGAIGCSVGRNIFQHPAPELMVRAIAAVFKDGAGAQEAFDRELREVVA
jgi:DhnA family fructose-bisphosphate aldolase class Ia